MIRLHDMEAGGHRAENSGDVLVAVALTVWIPVSAADHQAGESASLAIDAVRELGIEVRIGPVPVHAEIA